MIIRTGLGDSGFCDSSGISGFCLSDRIERRRFANEVIRVDAFCEQTSSASCANLKTNPVVLIFNAIGSQCSNAIGLFCLQDLLTVVTKRQLMAAAIQ